MKNRLAFLFDSKADHYESRRYQKNLMDTKPTFKPKISSTLKVRNKYTDEVQTKDLHKSRVNVPKDPNAFASYLMKEGTKV